MSQQQITTSEHLPEATAAEFKEEATKRSQPYARDIPVTQC